MQRLAKIRLPHGRLSVWLYDPQGRATCLSSKHGPLDVSKVPDWAVNDAGVKREIIALAARLDGLPAVQRVQRTLQESHTKGH